MEMLWKRAALSAGLSLIVNLVGLVVNYLSFRETNYLKWGFRRNGGEITIQRGFGWHAVHIYGMTPDQATSHSLRFSPVSFLIFVLAGAAVILLILTVIHRVRSR